MSDKKQVLVLQHFQENPPGRVGDLLNEHQIAYNVIQVGTDHLPDLTHYQALIVLGGTQHLYNKHKYPYTVHEEIYLHQAIRQGIPYLGMCLGGQLLANAFHATVSRLPKEQIGFLQIHFSEAGKQDPLYQGLPGYEQAFQWHEDCFALPEGAIALAHHIDGSNQAFRYGRHAYGIQYHVELTEDMLNTWLHDLTLKNEFIGEYGAEIYKKVERDVSHLFPTYAQHSRTLIENFLHISKLI
ncbi:MAG: type 1 glutamine amidotransferase [Ktedonobacteraceae bacterium]|nr:type 1 glutamine amidotransferase [Ktedonobacteraceae bacterium]